MTKPPYLQVEHPIRAAFANAWERNERRMLGGDAVIGELRPFDWEIVDGTQFDASDPAAKSELLLTMELIAGENKAVRPGDHYRFRQAMATYLNFPDMLATAMIGQLIRHRPLPGSDLDFGGLGQVRRAGRKRDDSSNAELIYFNADGVGNDGSQWDNYWAGAMQRAMATGHRWIYVDAPSRRATSRLDQVVNGIHPYLTDFGPGDALNWDIQRGQLQMIILEVEARRLTMDGDTLEGNDGTTDFLVMTRRGYTGLGREFAGGGWWLKDEDGVTITKGTWAKTGGEIPVFPLYNRRAKSIKGWPMMSIAATSELGNCAVSYMNVSSAADFDAWDAAASIQFLRGVDEEGWKLAMSKLNAGSRYVPLPANMESEGQVPIAQDASMGAVVASVFDMALKRKLDEAARLAATQAVSAPDSSGLSKSAGFGQITVPRLAMLASELENAQNTAIHFLEKRFGVAKPAGQVVWTRKFDLVEITAEITEFFNAQKLAGLRSETLSTRALMKFAREKGLITDEKDITTFMNEFMASARKVDQEAGGGSATPTPSSRGAAGTEPGQEGILESADNAAAT